MLRGAKITGAKLKSDERPDYENTSMMWWYGSQYTYWGTAEPVKVAGRSDGGQSSAGGAANAYNYEIVRAWRFNSRRACIHRWRPRRLRPAALALVTSRASARLAAPHRTRRTTRPHGWTGWEGLVTIKLEKFQPS